MDLALLVDKYLSDKRNLITEDDSFNIAEGSIFRWDFANIPCPTAEELAALSPIVEQELQASQSLEAKISRGAEARAVCQKVLDLVSGYNLDRELTIEQISTMQTSFSSAELALRSGRPTLAKAAIAAIVVDDVLVTQEMKDACLSLLVNY